MSEPFRGSYTVAVTPFTADGSGICVDSLKRFIDWQVECRVPGIIVLGTTGEFLTLDDAERQTVVRTTVEHTAGRMKVLVGTMNAYTPKAVAFSRGAQDMGADGLMIIPPYYYTPTEDEIFGYYKAICGAVQIPIMIYNNPVTSNVDMKASLVAKLTAAFENIRYIKEASMDVGRVYDLIEATNGVMNVFAGERPVESFLLGAVGYVNPYGNYLPYATTRMWEYLEQGRVRDAAAIQRLVTEMDHVIAEGHPTYGHQCYSKALAAAMGCPVGDVRPPITRFADLNAADKARLDTLVGYVNRINALVADIEARDEAA